jgi:integrase
VDKETAYQIVLDENRRLTDLVAALTAPSPPLPPPLPGPAPIPPAELGYDAYLAGSAPGEFITGTPALLARAVPPRLTDSYLAPKPPRRAYGDTTMPPVLPLAASVATGAAMPVIQAIETMLRAHTLDWAPTQRQNCRSYLLSPTGRFQRWCAARGISTIDDLTTAEVTAFLEVMLDAGSGPGLRASTVAKFRGHLRSLARFQAATPGFGSGLRDIDRIPAPRMSRDLVVMALTPDQESQILAACRSTRDRLILEVFLATGVRVSELAALTVASVLLEARPPRVLVRGSVHDPNCTKNRRPRQVPFRQAYASLPRRLGDWIQRERDPEGRSQRHELFLGSPRVPSKDSAPTPLGIAGLERLCTRIGERASVHFSPHILRRTWATRLVNAGVQPIHLMEVGGWSSIEMVRRYYTPDADEILAAIAAAGG